STASCSERWWISWIFMWADIIGRRSMWPTAPSPAARHCSSGTVSGVPAPRRPNQREHSIMIVTLAQPRGFCAGVDRAIAIVERALALHGSPIYVRHEVVHNRYVVEELRRKGA